MKNIFLTTNKNWFGLSQYGKVLVLCFLMSACFTSSLPAGYIGQAYSPGGMITSRDVCLTKEELIQKTRTLQMPFIANNGQIDDQVRFYAKTFGGTVFVTNEGEIVYALPDNNNRLEPGVRSFELDKRMHNYRGRMQDNRASCVMNLVSCIMHHASCRIPPRTGLNLNEFSLFNTIYAYINATNTPNQLSRIIVLKETLLGAKITEITGEQPAITTVSYFIGNDASKWKTNISTYNLVNLGDIYKGVELNLKAYGDNVEKLFCVKPGASPELIKVQIEGSKSLRVSQDGQLEADTELGAVKFTRPIAYQEIEGKWVEVECRYTIVDCGLRSAEGVKDLDFPLIPHSESRNPHLEYGFTVASYDKTKDLIIDPMLASTFLGGRGGDIGYSLAIDTNGDVYVAGATVSDNFPTTSGAYDTSFNMKVGDFFDVFVSKLDRGLTNLLASTFLGGNYEDIGLSLALDAGGNVYVTGFTDSIRFPTTKGAYDTSHEYLFPDVFISKLNSGLTRLLASTLLGGTGLEYSHSIAVNPNGDVYVTGFTIARDFPTTSGAYDTTFNGSSSYYEVFVSKLDGELTSLLASTFLGGSKYDWAHALALDPSGNVYVTGWTNSTDFPTTSGAYDTSFNGGGSNFNGDVFVSMLNSGLTSLLASTYLGGSDGDWSNSIAIDTGRNVYVTGNTASSDFPTTSGAYDTSYNGYTGNRDVFVSKLDRGLTSLLASTFLGGNYDDEGLSLALDAGSNVYVTGVTWSSDFPTLRRGYDTSCNGYADVFVSKLDGELMSLPASTYLGGFAEECAYSLALDTSGNVYMTGYTWSSDFPATGGAYDTSLNGYFNVFISKLDGNLSANDKCMAESITVSHDSLTLGKNGKDDITVTVIGADDCLAEGVTVTATTNGTGKRLLTVSPRSQKTGSNGQVIFSISAKDNTGTAVIKFKARGLNKVVTVQVKVR